MLFCYFVEIVIFSFISRVVALSLALVSSNNPSLQVSLVPSNWTEMEAIYFKFFFIFVSPQETWTGKSVLEKVFFKYIFLFNLPTVIDYACLSFI